MKSSMKLVTPAVVTVTVFAFALGGCTPNPVTGKRELVLMSPAQERAIGADAAQEVEQSIGLVKAPMLTAYVQTVGERLAAAAPRQDVNYRFFVADMEEPNAFALPGGYIYISRGLLAIMNTEAELANVLGHEIGHVAARHSAQRQTRQAGVGLLTAVGALLAGAKGGAQAARAVQELGGAAGAGLIASYGRNQERQSDEIGQQLAARTGWDPMGMRDFMAALGRYSTFKAGGKERRPSWLDSHPTTDERVESAQQRARTLVVARAPGVAKGRREFYRKVKGMLVGPNPSGGVFRGNLFLHPDLDFAIRLPKGWDKMNQPEALLAAPPSRDGMFQLQAEGPTGDPEAAAARFSRQARVEVVSSERLTVDGMRAFHVLARATSNQRPIALNITWIAHPKFMVRLTGLSSLEGARAFGGTFERVSRGFRRLRAGERRKITELRIDVVNARKGETLNALSRRTKNRWSLEETRLANGLNANRLQAGRPIKVAVAVPYGS